MMKKFSNNIWKIILGFGVITVLIISFFGYQDIPLGKLKKNIPTLILLLLKLVEWIFIIETKEIKKILFQ